MTDDIDPLAITSDFKVLGELQDTSGVGVLGQNNASNGTPIGVQGTVPNSSTGYGLQTPDNANVEGTLEVGTVTFADTNKDAEFMSVTENSDGNLEFNRDGTPTHEFTENGNSNITGELTENASL